MTKMTHKDNDPAGSNGHQEPREIVVDTTARHFSWTVETCSCTTDVQDTPITYTGATQLSTGDLLNLPLVVFLSSLESTYETEAVTSILTISLDFYFDAHLFNIQIKCLTCCQIDFVRLVQKQKH